MRSRSFFKLNSLVLLVFFAAPLVRADVPGFAEVKRVLADRIGDYRALRAAQPLGARGTDRPLGHDEFRRDERDENLIELRDSAAGRTYISPTGERFFLQVTITSSDSHAYALLTSRMPEWGESALTQTVSFGDVGTASVILPGRVLFYKGSVFVGINRPSGMTGDPRAMLAFARAVANTLDNHKGDIPVLLKHLPDWQQAEAHAAYSVTSVGLKESTAYQTIINEVSFDGGTEAVTANYGSAQLVIVEFNTPQLAGDNDRRITAKIQELRSQGHPVPTAYRRVGNYSVFVFHASNEQTASQLIDQVKYQQVVQWLGNSPDNLAQMEREFTEKTLGVFVSVVKASGLALVLCFAVGGFLGALLFSRRRARQAANEAYTDAGGMLRLNIDEMTTASHTSRLIGPGNG